MDDTGESEVYILVFVALEIAILSFCIVALYSDFVAPGLARRRLKRTGGQLAQASVVRGEEHTKKTYWPAFLLSTGAFTGAAALSEIQGQLIWAMANIIMCGYLCLFNGWFKNCIAIWLAQFFNRSETFG